MAFKFVCLFALVAVANAGFIPAAPLAYAAAPAIAKVATPVLAKAVDLEHDPHPQYSFNYDVQDSLTGDFKSQHETRDGDIVHGSYSLLEADGTRRTVDYTADDINGFNAVVRKEPSDIALKAVVAPAVAKIATPIAHAPVAYAAPAHYAYAAPAAHVAYAAPAIAKVAAPLAYAAPAAHVAYAAPAAQVAYAAPSAHVAYAAPAAQVAYAAPSAHVAYAAPAAHVAYAAPAIAKVASPVYNAALFHH